MATYRNIARGLEVLARHEKTGMDTRIKVGGDRLYAGPKCGAEGLPQQDRDRLEMAGWKWDEEEGRWGIYHR